MIPLGRCLGRRKVNFAACVKIILPGSSFVGRVAPLRYWPHCLELAGFCGRSSLDIGSLLDIIVVTRKPAWSRTHGQEDEGARPEDRCAARAGLAQRPSRRRYRRPLRGLRLLRRARSRAGQVRDAPSRSDRCAADHRERLGVRLLASVVLSGTVCFPAYWARRAVAEEARTPARAQVERGGRGVSRAAAAGGSIPASSRSRRASARPSAATTPIA